MMRFNGTNENNPTVKAWEKKEAAVVSEKQKQRKQYKNKNKMRQKSVLAECQACIDDDWTSG